MVLEPVCCPSCNSTNVVKNGKSNEGKQRYRCRNSDCSRCSFIQEYSYRGYLPEVKQQISDMAVNGSGIRDTARVLKISPTTVIEELKKRSASRTSEHNSSATDARRADDRDGGACRSS
jgi:transposase-like protein